MEINVNQDSNLEVKFKLSNIFGGSSPLFDVNIGKFSENTEVNLTLSKDDSKILSLGISEIKSTTKNTNDDGTSSTSTTTVSNTSIGLNKFNEKNILTDTVIKDEWENEESEKKAKDLNEVVSKITDVVDVYGSMIQKSSVLQNLITIDFAYTDNRDESKKKSISLQGKLASKIHFNDKCNIDDKYIEGYIPLNITQTADSTKDTTNSINKVNLQFIYSDNDASESHFTNYLEEKNTNRLKAGTQIGLSLGYASGADRSGSKLYAYSDHETVNSMLQSLSTIGKENTLWPYEIIRTVQAYSLNIESLINKKDISTTKILENLGINKSSNLINLLNGLNTSKDSDIETLTAKVNLGNLTGDEAFNNLDVNVTLNFKIGTKESTNDKGETINVRTVSLTSIDLQNVESSSNITLKVSLNLDNSLIQKDEVTDKTPLNDSTILSNFEPINGSSKYYIDAANLYNLLELGIYITNKKYYNIQGTLSFNSSVDLGLSDSLSVDNFTVLNNLNFDIKLNLYKNKPDNFNSLSDDEKNEQYYNKIYDIKGYLKVAPIGQQDYNFTEFMIEEDKIYVYKCSPNATEVTVEENTTVDPDNFNQYYDFFETSTNHLDSGTYKENGEELHFDFIEIITQTVSKIAADKKIDELAKQYGVKKDEKDDYFKCREGTSGNIIKKHYYYIEVLKKINNTTYTYKKYDNPTNTYNVQSYWMSKKTFLGDMNVINDSKGTIQVPRLMYYILDYSQVIKDSYAKVKYQALWGTKYTVGTIAVKNLMLANIFSSVTSDSGATLDYLSGWKFEINSLKSDDKIIITDGCFTIDPKSLIKQLNSGTGSLSFNCGINLSFKKDETNEEKDTWTFELSQTDTTNNIVTASMGSMSLNVKLEISKFNFTCSDNEDFISSEMKRMNDFIEEFNSNESTNKLGEYYIDTIETSEYSIGYSSGLYVSCKYNVSFNSESNRYNNSKFSEDNIGHL